MADPKQLRILKALTRHLEATPGYAPLKVFRGKALITAKEAEDCLSILEAPRPIQGSPAGGAALVRQETWTLLLQGWPKDDPANPSDPAYYLKAAVERHLAEIVREDNVHGILRSDTLYRLDGDVTGMSIGQGVVRPPEEQTSRLAMFYIPLVLEIQTDVGDPYS